MITRDKYFYLWFVHWLTQRTWTKLWWLWQHCKVQSRVDLEQFHLVQRPKSNGETTWLPKYWADIACKLHLTIRTSRLFLSILFRHLLQLLRQPENNWKIIKCSKKKKIKKKNWKKKIRENIKKVDSINCNLPIDSEKMICAPENTITVS